MHFSLPTEKSNLKQFLDQYLETQRADFDQRWSEDVFTRLQHFVTGGKMLRGLLVVLASKSYAKRDTDELQHDALKIAAAIELFQAGVLIHDDIIDQDRLRRGQLSMFAQYETVLQSSAYRIHPEAGSNLALCVGDIALFLASKVLATLQCEPQVAAAIQQLFSTETIKVGLAEMEDVTLSLQTQPVTEANVLDLYRYKTGRYSLFLPVAMGGILAGESESELVLLETWAEPLGMLFQLKDDELGLFGTTEQTGKPITADVKEGKKTVYYLQAMQRATAEKRERLQQLFGKSDITDQELGEVRDIVESTGARQYVTAYMNTLLTQSDTALLRLNLKPETQAVWRSLAHSLIARSR